MTWQNSEQIFLLKIENYDSKKRKFDFTHLQMTFPIEKQTNHRYKSIKFIYSHRHVSRTIDCYYYPYFSTIIEIPFPVNGKKIFCAESYVLLLEGTSGRGKISVSRLSMPISQEEIRGGEEEEYSWWGGGEGRGRNETSAISINGCRKWLHGVREWNDNRKIVQKDFAPHLWIPVGSSLSA